MIQNLKYKIQHSEKGFTLAEVLIAVFLTLIVFMGLLGGFQLGTKVVAQTRAKMQGVYLASQTIEEIRSLRFEEIETSQQTKQLNDILYDVQTIVETYDDCFDGTIEGFDCQGQTVEPDLAPDDYKKVKVYVSWQEVWGGEVNLSTIVAAKGLETGEGKGALKITVSTGLGDLVEITSADQLAPCPETSIEIINDNLAFDQCYGTSVNTPGIRLLTLDESVQPDDYKIIVQRQGYSRAETFQSGDIYQGKTIATPEQKNPTISQGELYRLTLFIDKLSDLNIYTLSPGSGDRFFDGFFDSSKIEEIENLNIIDKSVVLATTTPFGYEENGYLLSTEKAPGSIMAWDKFSFSDFEELETDIKYQLYYATSTNWFLVPDEDLPGNSLGFDSSPVDLTSLSVTEYPKLKMKGSFSTSELSKTPRLYEWQLSYKTSDDTAISDVSFQMRGEEIVGTDADEQPIYKYLEEQATDINGEKQLTGLDPDNYYFSQFSRAGQELTLNTELTEMPQALAPDTATSTKLYLETGNSLLVKVKEAETDNPIFGAEVELSSPSLGYNQLQTTNLDGDTLFLLLEGADDYHLEVRAESYQEEEDDFSLWTSQNKFINLERYE